MPPNDPVIRRARRDESDSAAALLWRVRRQNLGSIPPGVHPLEDMRRWMREVVFDRQEVWVADAGEPDGLVGLLVLAPPYWIEHLYVDEAHTRRGLGSRFVELALQELGGDAQLWTFQSNSGACRFYERHGFRAVQRTQGDNEEGAPDVLYQRRPPD